jgi:phosphohistidine phosphatase
MTANKKRIILMRHADSLPALKELDINRELSPIGIIQAEDAANFLAKLDIDKIITSHSVRTKQTLNIILQKFSVDKTQLFEEIYKETEDKILEIILGQSDDIKNLMIIGHNPSICMLAFALTKTTDKGYEHLMQKLMPPATIIVIDIPGITNWSELQNKHLGNITDIFTSV